MDFEFHLPQWKTSLQAYFDFEFQLSNSRTSLQAYIDFELHLSQSKTSVGFEAHFHLSVKNSVRSLLRLQIHLPGAFTVEHRYKYINKTKAPLRFISVEIYIQKHKIKAVKQRLNQRSGRTGRNLKILPSNADLLHVLNTYLPYPLLRGSYCWAPPYLLLGPPYLLLRPRSYGN